MFFWSVFGAAIRPLAETAERREIILFFAGIYSGVLVNQELVGLLEELLGMSSGAPIQIN